MSKLTLISKEVAIKEVVSFINKYSKTPTNEDKVDEDYGSILEAICSGNLVITDFKPKYTLLHPVVAENKENNITELSFRTRITPTTRADLADGLNLQKQGAKFSLRLIACIIAQPVAMLDRFDVDDYEVISELAAVFMRGGR